MSMQAWNRDLWTIDHPFVVGGLHLGARTTVTRLGDGGLAVVSPGPLDDAQLAAIARLGPVRALVAPNLMHHLFLGAVQRRFPEARVYAPPGLAKKQPTLTMAPLSSWPYGDTLAVHAVGGMPKLEESALVHRASRTLVLTDLAFNVRPPRPWWTRTFMRMNGAFDRFGPTKLCRRMVRDRAATAAAMARLCDEDFDRVVVAHGDVLETGGKAALREGFAWLLAAGATADERTAVA
jgi:hypothetical protein